jgi:hypothetical protein
VRISGQDYLLCWPGNASPLSWLTRAVLSYYAVFISELTARAYMIAESHKRRTVTRADISQAAGQSDMFDFLIDILPPDERKGLSSTGTAKRSTGSSWQKSQENNPIRSDEHKSCMPAVDAPLESSLKQAKTSGASSDVAQEDEQIVYHVALGDAANTILRQLLCRRSMEQQFPLRSLRLPLPPNHRHHPRRVAGAPQTVTRGRNQAKSLNRLSNLPRWRDWCQTLL